MRKTVCLHAAQAGTGKTHITANLAIELTLRGYHVGVLDADMITPGQHALFNLPADELRQTLNDYVWDEAELAACIYDITPQVSDEPPDHPPTGTLRLLPASPTPLDRDRILSEGYAVNLLVNALRDLPNKHQFDIVLVDTSPGFDHNTLLTACSSHLLLVTTTPDRRQHLDNTAYLMDRLRRINEPSMALIMNQVSIDDGDPGECSERYDLPLAACLPGSYALHSLHSSSLFIVRRPSHVWSKKIAQLADYITAEP